MAVKDSLQCAAVHIQQSRGLRNVAVILVKDGFDIFPADLVRFGRRLRRFWLRLRIGQKRVHNVLNVSRFRQDILGARFDRCDGIWQSAISSQHDRVCFRAVLFQGFYHVQTEAII